MNHDDDTCPHLVVLGRLEAENVRLKADNAFLKAEVERLTAFTTRTIIPNEELQAQVERLTKELENTDCMFAMASAFARDWQAAKEGKQP